MLNRSSILPHASRQLSSGVIGRIFPDWCVVPNPGLLENENCEHGNHRCWRLGNGVGYLIGEGWSTNSSLGPQRGSDRMHAKDSRKRRLPSRASASSFNTHHVGN